MMPGLNHYQKSISFCAHTYCRHKGQRMKLGLLLWGKWVNSRQLEKGCGKSRARRETERVGPYKEQQITRQTLSCLSVSLTQTSQETPISPCFHTLTLTQPHFLLSHPVPPASLWDWPDRMAASMWRMNGFWRRMAEVLVLSTLLLSSEYSHNYWL